MRTRLCLVVVGSLALSAVVRDASGQQTVLDPGQRIRVTLADGRRVTGLFVAQDADSLRIAPRPDAPSVALARAEIAALERSRGRHGHAGNGALIGLVTGGAAGGAMGASCEDEWLCPGPGVGALLLGAFGAGVGALVGVFVRGERWESFEPRAVAVDAGPVGRSVGLRVSIRF